VDVANRAGVALPQIKALAHAPFRIDRQIESLCRLLAEETENRFPFGPIYFESLAVALGICVIKRIDQLQSPSFLSREAAVLPYALRRAVEYMENHYSEPLTLDDLGEEARLSRSHFAVTFQQAIGCSPHFYLIQVRLRHACRLLAQTESHLSLSDIAAACGFSDQAHMTRLFRRFLKITPAALRRGVHQTENDAIIQRFPKKHSPKNLKHSGTLPDWTDQKIR
jgi:AraC family transcriptional regulator